jgi:primosomal protein N' (replication factor Y)
VVVWDDGDDLHAEPRAPYPHVREVLALRAHLTGAGMLVGGHARTAEAQLLLDTGWARALEPPRETVRACAPVVDGTGEEQLARDPWRGPPGCPGWPSRRPAGAGRRRAGARPGAPAGYVPSLACARDRTPARCPACSGPLAAPSELAVAACRWCGRLAGDWQCPQCEGRRLRAVVVGAGRTAEELGRAFPGTPVRTSGRDGVLARVGAEPSLVVSTPGAEPVADGGYGAVLLLDGWAALGRADLRAGEEALRRWFAAAALARPAPAGRVVVVADRALPPVQALIRWDPAGAAARELAERTALGLPARRADGVRAGPAAAVAELLRALPDSARADVLGAGAGRRGPRAGAAADPSCAGAELAAALKAAAGVRSARKAEPVRIELDPRTLA